MLENLIKYIKQFLQDEQILLNEPMIKHTTFRIGGKADIMLLPKSIDEILKCVDYCEKNNINYYVIGNGSNLLVSDKGFRGVIIKILKNFNNVELNGTLIKAQAGATLSSISKFALENSLQGFEFASSIPGSIGGGICMNAGAYGGELKDVVKNVTVMKDGKILQLDNDECKFEYRNSRILKEKLIVLEVSIELQSGNKDLIIEKMKDIRNNRNEKQPVEYASAGSTFKRPLNNFAGKLIMEAGLKGRNVGGAYVSEKHCGFIINKGDATCQDVLQLIDIVYSEVYNKFNIKLEKEIRVIGEQ